MELRAQAKPINQFQLRLHIEENFNLITDIFKAHKEDDYKKIVPLLLEEVFKKTNPNLAYKNIERSLDYVVEQKLKKSLEYTIKKHTGQYRDSGVHYASHPIHNGYLMAEFGFGEDVIISANLHDVPEENEEKVLEVMDEIQIKFGQKVLGNVLTLSIFEKGEERDKKQISKLWYASKQMGNYDVLYLKLADVITNLFTKQYMTGKKGMTAEERQRKYSMNVEKHILPIAQLIDRQGNLDLHITSYLEDLMYR